MRWALIVVLASACRGDFDPIYGPNGQLIDGAASSDGIVPDANTIPIDAAPGTLLPATVADTYLQGTDPSPNGALLEISCGRYSGSGANMFALWRFDLTGVPATISSATLRLYQDGASGTIAMSMEIYRLAAPWDEATADWNNASTGMPWTNPGGAPGTPAYATTTVQLGANGFYDWNVTSLVNEWTSGAQPNYGLEMQYMTQPSPGTYAIFSSRENPNVTQRPQLLITP